jgi:hypothetical protein
MARRPARSHRPRGTRDRALARPVRRASITAFRAAERAGEILASPHAIGSRFRGDLLIALLRAGDVAAVERTFAELDELGVNQRAEAVARARELGLLAPAH